jgi:hypothetical protein
MFEWRYLWSGPLWCKRNRLLVRCRIDMTSNAESDVAMLNSIIIYVVQILILWPFQTQISAELAKANAPYEVIAQIKTCASSAMPILIQRVSDDPWWGARTIVDVWVRGTAPERVIGDAAASCGPAIEAARPYVRRARALGA